jgi:hypothetical protein
LIARTGWLSGRDRAWRPCSPGREASGPASCA